MKSDTVGGYIDMSKNQFEWNEAINKIFEMTKEEREEYVAKITDGSTSADEIFEFVDGDVKSIENYVARDLYKIFMQEDPEGFSKVRKQILKKQKVDYFKNYSYERLLLLNHFCLERGKKGTIWILSDEKKELQNRLIKAFGEEIEELSENAGEEIVIVECKKDFKKGRVVRGNEVWEMDTDTFMECVEKI
ncbi:MAG: hypothetical protein RSD28_02475 [Lachnospiraceae bacterium]